MHAKLIFASITNIYRFRKSLIRLKEYIKIFKIQLTMKSRRVWCNIISFVPTGISTCICILQRRLQNIRPNPVEILAYFYENANFKTNHTHRYMDMLG